MYQVNIYYNNLRYICITNKVLYAIDKWMTEKELTKFTIIDTNNYIICGFDNHKRDKTVREEDYSKIFGINITENDKSIHYAYIRVRKIEFNEYFIV